MLLAGVADVDQNQKGSSVCHNRFVLDQTELPPYRYIGDVEGPQRPPRLAKGKRIVSMAKSSLKLAAAAVLLVLAIPAHAASPTVVNAELWNKPDGSQGVTLSTSQVKPSKVIFHVKNLSTDEDHELLLVKTDLAPVDFPMDESGTRVDEDKFKGLKELGDVHPGKSRTTTLTLKAGKYILFCNEQGHFKAGMLTPFTVVP
jgi:uncharacterized cupredoxin-like copper-binding protein